MTETRKSVGPRRAHRPANGSPPARTSWPPLPGKYGHGLALAPHAEALAEAFLRLSGQDALRLLLTLHNQGQDLDEIEKSSLEPALTKVGELWLRGRIDDSRFDEFSELAENVERQFRLAIAVPGSVR